MDNNNYSNIRINNSNIDSTIFCGIHISFAYLYLKNALYISILIYYLRKKGIFL